MFRVGVVGDAPGGAVEGSDHAGLSGLCYLAVVGGVGLAGDEEDLAHSHVQDVEKCDGGMAVEGTEFDCVGAAGRSWYSISSGGEHFARPHHSQMWRNTARLCESAYHC